MIGRKKSFGTFPSPAFSSAICLLGSSRLAVSHSRRRRFIIVRPFRLHPRTLHSISGFEKNLRQMQSFILASTEIWSGCPAGALPLATMIFHVSVLDHCHICIPSLSTIPEKVLRLNVDLLP